MKILITGGAGLIGSNLIKFYLGKKNKITTIDNYITGQKENIKPFLSNPDFTFIQQDITTFDFQGLPPFDIIYQLASPASPIQYKKHPLETLMANSIGTKNVFDFALRSKSRRVIIASTSEVYGDPLEHPQKEAYFGNVNSFGERSCYDESKRFAEALAYIYIHKFNLDVRIARIFNTYGPNMEKNDGRVISNFIVQTLSDKSITIYGTGKQTRSFCYVSDMIKGLDKVANSETQETIFNLGNPHEISILKLAKIIKGMTNAQSNIVFKPATQDDPKKRMPDITKAKKILQWKPKINLHTGLTETIKYFQERFNL